MSRNRPESNRAAQAAHRARLRAAGYQRVAIDLSLVDQRWLDRERGDRSRSRALSDLIAHCARCHIIIPPPKEDTWTPLIDS